MSLEDLTDEQKAKARERKTPEDILALPRRRATRLLLLNCVNTAMFQVQLDNGSSATCHLSGQLRMNYARIAPGDRVRVQTNPGDPSRGRIVWRYK